MVGAGTRVRIVIEVGVQIGAGSESRHNCPNDDYAASSETSGEPRSKVQPPGVGCELVCGAVNVVCVCGHPDWQFVLQSW